jgi:hypothetical protein
MKEKKNVVVEMDVSIYEEYKELLRRKRAGSVMVYAGMSLERALKEDMEIMKREPDVR